MLECLKSFRFVALLFSTPCGGLSYWDLGTSNPYSAQMFLKSVPVGYTSQCLLPWIASYRSFLAMTSAATTSSMDQAGTPNGYLMVGSAYVLMAWVLFLPLRWLLSICLILWRYSAVADLLAFSSWPSTCSCPVRLLSCPLVACQYTYSICNNILLSSLLILVQWFGGVDVLFPPVI